MELTDIREHLGRRVKERRERLGLSRDALAQMTEPKLSSPTIFRLEKGKVWPEFDNLEAVASALGVAVEFFFCELPLPEPPLVQALEEKLTEQQKRIRELEARWKESGDAEIEEVLADVREMLLEDRTKLNALRAMVPHKANRARKNI